MKLTDRDSSVDAVVQAAICLDQRQQPKLRQIDVFVAADARYVEHEAMLPRSVAVRCCRTRLRIYINSILTWSFIYSISSTLSSGSSESCRSSTYVNDDDQAKAA